MKKIRTILSAAGILAVAALAMISCSKEDVAQVSGLDEAKTISVSVSGLMGDYTQDDGTKAALISNVRVSWGAGDKVYAFDGTQCLGYLNVSLKDSKDYYALLTGELREPAIGTTKITLVYASGFSATQGQTITDGKLSFDISSQTGGSDSKNTPFVAFGTIDYTEGTPSLEDKIVDFTLATSVMRINCTGLEASTAITGAKLMGMSSECVLNVTNAGAELGQGAIGNISLSFADGYKASASGAQVIYAGIAKNSTASAQTLEVNQSKTYGWSFGNKTRDAANSINAICQLTEILPYVVIPAKYDGTNVTDLKWYRQNLAISPSGNKSWKGGNSSAVKVPGTAWDVINGDYFQWAAYEGYAQVEEQTVEDRGLLVYESFTSRMTDGSETTDEFQFKSGKSFEKSNAPYDDGDASYTKYCANDGKTILENNDDVANIILGDSWRMPTQAEFEAMCGATYWAWDATDSGFYVFKPGEGTSGLAGNYGTIAYTDDKTKALLFFPCAGQCQNATLIFYMGISPYWSSSGRTILNSFYSYSLALIDGGYVYPEYVDDCKRYLGYTVRPVSD